MHTPANTGSLFSLKANRYAARCTTIYSKGDISSLMGIPLKKTIICKKWPLIPKECKIKLRSWFIWKCTISSYAMTKNKIRKGLSGNQNRQSGIKSCDRSPHAKEAFPMYRSNNRNGGSLIIFAQRLIWTAHDQQNPYISNITCFFSFLCYQSFHSLYRICGFSINVKISFSL